MGGVAFCHTHCALVSHKSSLRSDLFAFSDPDPDPCGLHHAYDVECLQCPTDAADCAMTDQLRDVCECSADPMVELAS